MRSLTLALRGFFIRLRRVSVAVPLCVVAFGYVGCSDDDDDLNFAAHVGEACDNCESCKSLVDSCVCRTCTEFAFDDDKKAVLICTARGSWEVVTDYASCPGGGSVNCARGGYDIRCLDEHGDLISR